MSILVTGAGGFIGSHLCDQLLAQGQTVTGLDNFDPFYEPKTKHANLQNAHKNARFKLVKGDIRDKALVERILGDSGVEAIVHLAAKAGVRPSLEDPLGYQDVNVGGTLTLLEAARQRKIERFIFASSSSVYGNNEKIPFAESDSVDHPISPYAATKKAGELLCHTWHHLYGMNVTCLRFFTVYGPRQRPDLAIHKFARLIREGKPLPVYGDGSMERDYTYIDDILDGVTAGLERCRGYEVINLGESRPVRLDELIIALEGALGRKATIKRVDEQPGDVRRTCADIGKARRLLGYKPKTELKSGLARFVTWLDNEADVA